MISLVHDIPPGVDPTMDSDRFDVLERQWVIISDRS